MTKRAKGTVSQDAHRQPLGDTVRSWLVCLVPRRVCMWLWEAEMPMGRWAPHVLGRILGCDAIRIKMRIK